MKKNNFKRNLIMLMSIITCLSLKDKVFAQIPEKDIEYAKVIKDAYLFSEPNENSSVYTKIESKVINYDLTYNLGNIKEVELISKSIDNWSLVKYEDIYGFIENDKLVFDNYNIDVIGPHKTNYSCEDNINVYEEDNIESQIIGLLEDKEEIHFLNNLNNGFYEILYNGDLGYIEDNNIIENRQNYYLPNKFYKVVYLKEDSNLYNYDHSFIKTLPKYEVGEVYNEINDMYLIKTNEYCGYINKSDVMELSGTFVVVDESDQQLKLYKNNEVVLTSDVVSGKLSSPTNIGAHSVLNKDRNRTLVGRGYRSFVKYWMRFDEDAEGLHDASWRSTFGTKVSRNSGSHGCVNLPTDVAAYLYDELEVGDSVIVKR